jgi:membrane associated rhomboid family serine protease
MPKGRNDQLEWPDDRDHTMVATLASNQTKERCLGSTPPVLCELIWGCVLAILSFGVNFVVDGRPVTSPKHLVGLAVAAIVGGLVGGLVVGALMAWWFTRHEHHG